MCAVMAICFAGCTPEDENSANSFIFSLSTKGNSIIVTWDAVPEALFYELQLDSNEVVRTDTIGYRFEDLQYNTKYSVTLKAISLAGKTIKSGTNSITIGKREIPAFREWVGGLPVNTISNNGRWAVGCFDMSGIIIDLTTDKVTITDQFSIDDVDDNGIAVGSYHGKNVNGVAAMYVDGNIIEIDLSEITADNSMSGLTAITPDGSYAVGWWQTTPGELWETIYGMNAPFCYDVVNNKVSVPEPGSRLYNEGALSLYSVSPDRSILGCDQTSTGDGINVMVDTIWEDEYTPYKYVFFDYDTETGLPTSVIGDTNNRFSQSGKYVYGRYTTFEDMSSKTQPTVYDVENKTIYNFDGIGAVTAFNDKDGIVFMNDVPSGCGTTVFVTTLDKRSYADFLTLEEWLLTEHNINIAEYEPRSNTNTDNSLWLDGVIVTGVSADGRTIVAMTSSYDGWINTVIYLDGVK